MQTALNTGYGPFMGAGGFGLEVRSDDAEMTHDVAAHSK